MSEMSKAREASENFENSKSTFSEPKSDSLVSAEACGVFLVFLR